MLELSQYTDLACSLTCRLYNPLFQGDACKHGCVKVT